MQDDVDNPPFFVGEEVLEAVDLAVELARHQGGDVGQRARLVGLEKAGLELVILLGCARFPQDGVEVEAAIVDDDEAGFRLVPGETGADVQPARHQVGVAAAAQLVIERL